MTAIPLCGDCDNNKICVRSRYQDNCLLHSRAEKYFTNKVLETLDTSLNDAINDIQYSPHCSLSELERGEIIGLLDARVAIEKLLKNKDDE
jgi:hypothetical protein